MTLSDTHLVLLSAAAQRDDHLLPRPERLFGAALDRLATRLLGAGLVETLDVATNQPRWGETGAGTLTGLRITPAGLAAIGLADTPEAAVRSPGQASRRDTPTASDGTGSPKGASADPQARLGSKRALMVERLQQPSGASVEELQAATGWLPHTVRAALSGLRKAGYTLRKAQDDAKVTRYHLEASAPEDLERTAEG